MRTIDLEEIINLPDGSLTQEEVKELVFQIGYLRATLGEVFARSNPMHSTVCAGQNDDDPCICSTGEVMERAYRALGMRA